jgi:hypothetical protein
MTVKISRRRFLKTLVAGWGASALTASFSFQPTAIRPSASAAAAPSPTGSELLSWRRLPRWRGFNLLEKFNCDTPSWNTAYNEWDFDFLAEWGFDFVRLPLDYRIWTVAPGQYLESALKEIDQAIEWARARKIHVNVALHYAPGYRVWRGYPRDLWADGQRGEEARREFAMQWRMFAARYRGIPSSELSFNLVNEPPDIPGQVYFRTAAVAVEAIRSEDPDRLIIADGAEAGWALRPVPELVPLKLAQSMRGYQPPVLTHYRARWVEGSDSWPVPTWPIFAFINRYLYGDAKRQFKSPLILRGDFTQAAQLVIRLDTASDRARLQIRADGRLVFDRLFAPGPGQGEWKESTFRPEWNIYQAVYDREYVAPIPSGTREIRIEVTEGDWLRFSEIRITPYPTAEGQAVFRPADWRWGVRQEAYDLDVNGIARPANGRVHFDRERLWKEFVEPWKRFADTGVGVHVGEWGAYNRTPHNVVLAWMADCLELWKRAGFGWALWNLRGPFGVLDSERADVKYEDYKGHKLDREMLDLLLQG